MPDRKYINLRVSIQPEIYPDLYAALETVQSKNRSERIRHLAALGLLIEQKGMTANNTAIPQSAFFPAPIAQESEQDSDAIQEFDRFDME